MAGFLDALDDEPVALVPAEERPVARYADPQLEKLKQREDRILEKTMGIVERALGAADRADDNVARDALMSPKEHPVYLDLAKSVMVGIMKARATAPRDPTSLNVSITLAAPTSARKYLPQVIDVEAEPVGEPDPVIDIDPEQDVDPEK
jgi:hypothetical protein